MAQEHFKHDGTHRTPSRTCADALIMCVTTAFVFENNFHIFGIHFSYICNLFDVAKNDFRVGVTNILARTESLALSSAVPSFQPKYTGGHPEN